MRMTRTGIAVRVVAAVAFCLATYNGSGYHLAALAQELWTSSVWPVLFGGAVWSAAAAFLVWTTLASLGKVGIGFVLAILATAVGWAISAGVLDGRSMVFWQYAVPAFVGLTLGLGMIAGYTYRLVTGRVQTEDPDT